MNMFKNMSIEDEIALDDYLTKFLQSNLKVAVDHEREDAFSSASLRVSLSLNDEEIYASSVYL